MIRSKTSYGPMLPDGVLEDDGAERGIIFLAAGARLDRQVEFVKTEWINSGRVLRLSRRTLERSPRPVPLEAG